MPAYKYPVLIRRSTETGKIPLKEKSMSNLARILLLADQNRSITGAKDRLILEVLLGGNYPCEKKVCHRWIRDRILRSCLVVVDKFRRPTRANHRLGFCIE